MPKEIVDTGTCASAALRAAVNAPRGSSSASGPPGTVCLPSVISTIRAGGGPSPDAPTTACENVSIDCSAAKIASPVAVDSASLQPVDGPLDRLPVGGRRHQHRRGARERHEPEVHPGRELVGERLGRRLRRGQPAGRDVGGLHRQRHVDHEHDRGPVARHPRLGRAGPASATVSRASATSSAAAGRCRYQPGRFGATLSSSSRLVNASVSRRRRRSSSDVADRERRPRRAGPASHQGCGEDAVHRPPPDQARLRASDEPHDVGDPVASRCAAAGAPPRRGAGRAATRSRCAAAAAANSRHSSGVVTTSRWRPVSGSASTTVPTSGSSSSRGSSTSTASSSWRPDSARRVALPRGLAEEVGHHHGQAAAPRRAAQRFDRRREVAAGAARRAAAPARPCAAARARAPGRRGPGSAPSCSPGGDERADPVAAAPREVRDGGERGDGEVALLAGGGAEVEAGRQVHHHPRLQLAVGHGLAHVRLGGAGGDRPVHAPHVVAGLVGAGLARLGARAGDEPEVVALQQPVQPDPHRQLERLERGLQPALRAATAARCSSGAAWRRCRRGRACGRAVTCGNGTVASTREMMWSTGTSSATAS